MNPAAFLPRNRQGAFSPAGLAAVPVVAGATADDEPEPRLRALATRAAADSSVPVEVRGGRAENPPVADGSVDGVAVTLVLCGIADVEGALAEAARVLRPGGQLYFYEHIRSADPRFARKQRGINIVQGLTGTANGPSWTPDSRVSGHGTSTSSSTAAQRPARRVSSASPEGRKAEESPSAHVPAIPSGRSLSGGSAALVADASNGASPLR
ncbi:class I SAM-dependent methyltransferase [Streptomyces sp. NPDC058195]|uniref:class I SAM-dependent methyltransferase n=1 Tax=Streptomyces sp. NPDC058195 TaxID=3346375 RepID=UPI0036E07F67